RVPSEGSSLPPGVCFFFLLKRSFFYLGKPAGVSGANPNVRGRGLWRQVAPRARRPDRVVATRRRSPHLAPVRPIAPRHAPLAQLAKKRSSSKTSPFLSRW